jgi:hypothetical protein
MSSTRAHVRGEDAHGRLHRLGADSMQPDTAPAWFETRLHDDVDVAAAIRPHLVLPVAHVDNDDLAADRQRREAAPATNRAHSSWLLLRAA